MKVSLFLRRALAGIAVSTLLIGILPAQALADSVPTITITSPAADSTSTTDSVTVSFSVENVTVGTDSDHVHYYLDSDAVVMIYSTDSFTLSNLSEGTHTLKMVVADVNHTDYTNTEASATVNFTVALPQPDLTVTDVYLDGDNTLSVTVANQGNEDVTTTAGKTYIYIDGTLTWTYSWSTLADQTFMVVDNDAVIQPQVLSGEHTVKACVDPTDVVDESNEDNNCLEAVLTPYSDDTEDAGDDDISDDQGNDDTDTDDSDVDLGQSASDFASATGYDVPKFLVVKWGVLNPDVASDAEEDGSATTTWDGTFSVANGLMHLDHTVLFEHKQQKDKVTQVRDTNHKPTAISFDSAIGPHYDGLAVRYRAATGTDPVFTFETAYDDLTLSVSASDLADGPYIYDAGDGYGVWIGFVDNTVAQNQFFPGGGLFEIRYGDLSDVSSSTATPDVTTYNGTLTLTGEGSLKILKTYLFDEGQNDKITTEEGSTVAWTSEISGHWDGLLVQFKPSGNQEDVSEDRGLTLTIGGLTKTFDSKDDFGVFAIGDGTENQVEVRNFMGNADEVHQEFVDAKLDLSDDLAGFATALQDAADSGDYSDDLMSELQDVYDALSAYNFVPGTYGLAQRALIQLTNSLNNGETEDQVQGLLDKLKTEYETAKENARKRKFALGILKFKDVDDDGDTWYGDYVGQLADLNILTGYKDDNGNALGEFRPSWNITYAEALKIVLLATGNTIQSGDPENYYADTSWAKDYVYTGEQLDLTVLDDTYLDLNTEITRGEFVRLILEALNVAPGSYSSYAFPDISGDENAAYIQYAYEQGIVSGNPDGNFYPDRSINRAESAKIMSKVIDLYSLEAAIES